uniref:Uncharacterized protein n=1 Tax=Caenorhabditis japonica TaxID=281687 RepID=A0A8R1HYE0_CAEJA
MTTTAPQAASSLALIDIPICPICFIELREPLVPDDLDEIPNVPQGVLVPECLKRPPIYNAPARPAVQLSPPSRICSVVRRIIGDEEFDRLGLERTIRDMERNGEFGFPLWELEAPRRNFIPRPFPIGRHRFPERQLPNADDRINWAERAQQLVLRHDAALLAIDEAHNARAVAVNPERRRSRSRSRSLERIRQLFHVEPQDAAVFQPDADDDTIVDRIMQNIMRPVPNFEPLVPPVREQERRENRQNILDGERVDRAIALRDQRLARMNEYERRHQRSPNREQERSPIGENRQNILDGGRVDRAIALRDQRLARMNEFERRHQRSPNRQRSRSRSIEQRWRQVFEEREPEPVAEPVRDQRVLAERIAVSREQADEVVRNLLHMLDDDNHF